MSEGKSCSVLNHTLLLTSSHSFDLPDDVFVPGEMKPQKKSAVARTGLNGKKREATEVNFGRYWRVRIAAHSQMSTSAIQVWFADLCPG